MDIFFILNKIEPGKKSRSHSGVNSGGPNVSDMRMLTMQEMR